MTAAVREAIAANAANVMDLQSDKMCIRDRIATAESASATVSCDPAIYLGNKLDLRLGIDFGRTNDPVSYTHLDVYKRQPLWGGLMKKLIPVT